MATTSAFGWETPDDTDLVKDGAAAIRTLGNSIDTSLADLKGGSTGQVLSKTSATDMDFTWVSASTQYPWTSYTPTLTAITLGNGTLTASYQQIGKTVNVRILFTLGSTSAVSSFPRFSLPINVDVPSTQVQILGNANLNDAGTTSYYGVVAYETASTVQVFAQDTSLLTLQRAFVTATVPFTWTTSDQMLLNFSYRGV
jgi:hypothetical protein